MKLGIQHESPFHNLQIKHSVRRYSFHILLNFLSPPQRLPGGRGEEGSKRGAVGDGRSVTRVLSLFPLPSLRPANLHDQRRTKEASE